MSAVIIDGRSLAAKIREDVRSEILRCGIRPCLAVVMIGDDPSSAIYVRNKEKACAEIGIKNETYRLPINTSQSEAEQIVKDLAERADVHGILVQLPLPPHLDEQKLLSLIPTEKDVDGFSDKNVGSLLLGKECLIACTPYGITELIKNYGIEIEGKRAVVVGRSNIVGKPVALLLLGENATVTVCHSKTRDLAQITRQADILVVAIGRAKFITADMIKPGAVVIDVGTNRVDGKLCGDVDFENAKEVAGYITPVPGGVGPMTIAMLMKNTLIAAKRLNGID